MLRLPSTVGQPGEGGLLAPWAALPTLPHVGNATRDFSNIRSTPLLVKWSCFARPKTDSARHLRQFPGDHRPVVHPAGSVRFALQHRRYAGDRRPDYAMG